MMDAHLGTRLSDSIQEAFRSYTVEFKKKAQAERKRYINPVENSMKDIIKDEVKSQLPQILPKEVFEFATPMIQSTITESLENVILAQSYSQSKSTYEAAASLTEFELKKILLDKMQKSKSYRAAQEHRDLYDALVKSYKLEKDLFESYNKAYYLKRDRDDKDKDEDPPAGSDQGLKKQNTGKDAELIKGSKSKESKSSSSKGTKSQSKSSNHLRHGSENFPKQKNLLTFDELVSTPIDFLAYVMNDLKIENLTQEHLVGPAFNLLKGTWRSRVELEYHFKECYKVVTDRLYLNNPEGNVYTFNLSKPLPLIEDQGRQVIPVNYFINNDLEYLKGGSSRIKYMTSTKKTKDAKYDDIQGIEDMVPLYLEEIEVRREDQQLYKFRKGNFPRLNLRYIEDMLLFLVQKKLSNLERDVIFYLNVALRMSDISNMTPYTAYNNPQGIIYLDKLKRNRFDMTKEQKNETRRTNSALWDSRRLEVKQ
ncbi:hypothetical protein Tco_0788048 [Tanacetum coccineum]